MRARFDQGGLGAGRVGGFRCVAEERRNRITTEDLKLFASDDIRSLELNPTLELAL